MCAHSALKSSWMVRSGERHARPAGAEPLLCWAASAGWPRSLVRWTAAWGEGAPTRGLPCPPLPPQNTRTPTTHPDRTPAGERMQIHRMGDKIMYFSRNGFEHGEKSCYNELDRMFVTQASAAALTQRTLRGVGTVAGAVPESLGARVPSLQVCCVCRPCSWCPRSASWMASWWCPTRRSAWRRPALFFFQPAWVCVGGISRASRLSCALLQVRF